MTNTQLITRSQMDDLIAARDGALSLFEQAAEMRSKAAEMASQAVAAMSAFRGIYQNRALGQATLAQFADIAETNFDSRSCLDAARKVVDGTGWQHMRNVMNLDQIMDADARSQFTESLGDDVLEFTQDNVSATVETLLLDSKNIFRRGLARAFSKLSPRFKSHDGFKLKKRMIIEGLFDQWGTMNCRTNFDAVDDIERIFAILDNQLPDVGALQRKIRDERRKINNHLQPFQSEHETEYFGIRCFKNGNAHIWFRREDLVEKANLELAAWYGEVLADAFTDEDLEGDLLSKTGLPSKDLAFYATPEHVANKIVNKLNINKDRSELTGKRVLEPSAGEGGLVKPLLLKGAIVDAIEYHAERVNKLNALQHSNLKVVQANFLQVAPNPVYDFVVMNPPFYGTHWMEHVVHGLSFLKKGGRLVTVLPISASNGTSAKHVKFHKWVQTVSRSYYSGQFQDLPEESFKSSGTNINTVILTIEKK
ncbi:DUF4942 domain-containing protein [Pseudovibrio ascidiaceicola]|uniref:DUF4942 domain-containing protein n=1 Tax=Pseudovibrio ascidiaceicola TaxID=285279 RepID=UPI003D35DF73